MNTANMSKTKWFWPWQDEKEEAWLEEMSRNGWHLKNVQLLCTYTFQAGDPCSYAYRMDYMPSDKSKWAEYRQFFEDAGWEYLGELSNWRYWRKPVQPGETADIFTDNASKLKKYRRLLGYMLFFLGFLLFIGYNFLINWGLTRAAHLDAASTIYLVGVILYAILIPVYIVVVVQIYRRIRQIQRKTL